MKVFVVIPRRGAENSRVTPDRRPIVSEGVSGCGGITCG
jgi:hypothetical protein